MNNSNLIKSFVIKQLEEKKNIPKEMKTDIENFRYLDYGQIDSLELISFITSIEKKFSIKFSPKDLSSKEFRVFSGLIKLIEKKL
tara:strand:- start:97 stop:351 length:255 start_codon:yes stop_codon:yes gene_type:complete